jgi:serine/threonine protein kinase
MDSPPPHAALTTAVNDPAQVLVGDRAAGVFSILISDYGCNRPSLHGATPTQPVADPLRGLGTRGHVSPEQLDGRVGPGSDVWALGQAVLQLQEGLALLHAPAKHGDGGEPWLQAERFAEWVTASFPSQAAVSVGLVVAGCSTLG